MDNVSSSADSDEKYMKRAIALGNQARLISPPNPWVGCVIVKNGVVIGEGFTRSAGQAHAEIDALKSAKDDVREATVYVTLEPCSHYGRTPPCVSALILAKVSRVVIANEDPDPKVSGKGIQLLRQAGIDVVSGICAQEAAQAMAPYLHQRKTKKPYCVVKTAMSIDGRAAAADSSSKWITSQEARLDAHHLRAHSQAILVGVRTALIDNPSLTVRDITPMPIRQPLRVVLDAQGRLQPPMNIFDLKQAPTLIATTDKCPNQVIKQWEQIGVEVKVFPYFDAEQGIDLASVLEFLGAHGIIQLLVEGGPTTLGIFIKNHFFDRLVTYIGPCILGDNAIPAFKNVPIDTLKNALALSLIDLKRVGNCVRLDFDKASK